MTANMDGFVFPILPTWFNQNAFVATPDGGLMYSSRFDVSYVPAFEPNRMIKIVQMKTSASVEILACPPDWTEKRIFATFDENKNLYIWDLDLKQPVQGHRGHAGPSRNVAFSATKKKQITAAICFSANEKLLSCDHSRLIVYCLLSDTYTVTTDLFQPKCIVVVLVPSPVDRDVFIAGMNDGLIQIFSIKKMSILHSLRGHDKEIISISCMSVPVLKEKITPTGKKQSVKNSPANQSGLAKQGSKPRPTKKARKKAVPEADASDFFDIYDFNDGQEKFGTGIDRETQDERDRFREKTKTVEGFNFLEACENLKDDILKAATRREEDDDEEEDDEAGERSHIKQEDFNTDDENELDDCEKLRDYVVVGSEGSGEDAEEQLEDEEDSAFVTKLVLLCSSREPNLWLWDYETGLPIDKIYLPFISNDRICNTDFVTADWLDERHIVANNSNGNVFECKVSFLQSSKRIRLESEMSLAPYPVEKIIHVVRAKSSAQTGSEQDDRRYLWCSGINRKLVCLEVAQSGKPTVVLDYGCAFSFNRCLLENPLESMIIAIGCAAPRIDTFNLANIQYDRIKINPVINKICGAVMVVDWHPEEEQKIAFGTNEGRIGVIDIGSIGNVPVLLKPFINKEVYALKWCYLTEANKQKRLVLFASGKYELAYYHMTGSKKYEPIMCQQFGEVSSVSAANNLCFVGTHDGTLYVCDLDHNLQQLYRRKISKRYISALEYKQQWLAVASNDETIALINFADESFEEGAEKISLLEGHSQGICKVRWSRGETMLLVSTSFDCTIRVWDALSATCLSVFKAGCFLFSAIFSPLDENIIMYVGKGCSLSFFDYTKPQTDFAKEAIKPQIKLAIQSNAVANVSKKSKKSARVQDLPKKSVQAQQNDGTPAHPTKSQDAIEQLTDEVKKVTLKENTSIQLRTNVMSTFQLAYREVNRPKDVLECIVKLLHTVERDPEPEPSQLNAEDDNSDDEHLKEVAEEFKEVKSVLVEEKQMGDIKETSVSHGLEGGKLFYNEKLFTTEEKLKQLIQEEVDNHHTSATSSIGMVILPQLLHKLKEVILASVSKKKLTPQLLALAPYVSHIFWRQCCQAYAYQLIETQQSLAAVPYFLASHKVDDCIEALCDAKYYREAWAVCRLQKMADDPILEKVATEWADHLDSNGNLEAAALVWTGVKKYKNAITVLMKRREITEDIQRTIDELSIKLQESVSDDTRKN